MHLSLSVVCHLCATTPVAGGGLTNVYSEGGKQENLLWLLNEYITPFILLPKNDKLCLCDTCKSRLKTWDCFLHSCKNAQEKLKGPLGETWHDDLDQAQKRQISEVNVGLKSSSSNPKKKRSSNYCIARWCNMGNHQGISLFRLPRERERALKWLSAAERSDLQCMTVLHSYYVCAKHFTQNMFTNKACNQLIRNAVPTIFPRPLYADKIALKAAASMTVGLPNSSAASQVLPSQFQGVQLKSILPKVSLPINAPSHQDSKTGNEQNLADPIILQFSSQWIPEKASMNPEQNSNVVLKVVSTDTPSGLAPDSLIPIINSFSSTSKLQDCNPSVFLTVSSNTNEVKGSTYFPSKSVRRDSTDTPVECNLGQSSCSNSGELVITGNSTPERNLELGESARLQKICIEPLETCFTADAFNPSVLLSADSVIHNGDSNVKEIGNITLSLLSHSNESSESAPPGEDFLSSVGSQDFLLPHISIQSENASSCFGVSSFTPEAAVNASDASAVTGHGISRENTVMLSHNHEVNSPCVSLFDLHAEDTQGTDNSSYVHNIENLDELMDLDQYFEGR